MKQLLKLICFVFFCICILDEVHSWAFAEKDNLDDNHLDDNEKSI